ncbi:MAG: DNA-processing protein DprA [Defluviitaleaceae bacterium]|nr:DNA-processing protein DprA [Defluviitaleaceae bacterium]
MDIYMYWLTTLYMLGSHKQNSLIRHFGEPRLAFTATDDALAKVPTLTPHHIKIIKKNRNQKVLEYGFEMLEKRNISFTYLGHTKYPNMLNDIQDPPIGLFYLGDFPSNNLMRAAIIGSRRCSEYGLNTANTLAKVLAKNNVVVVSGMARGIDSMAHRGALDAGGLTIAVLGCGIDICYPAENLELRDKIARNGCVISEYPPGVAPRAMHFPARNRIISGLSKVVVVAEAAKRSGTLITVDQALEQGREVMAVPGNITNKYSEGTNNLIKQGAEPICAYEDVLNIIGISSDKYFEGNRKTRTAESELDLANDEKLVYDALSAEPLTIEEIIVKTSTQPQILQHILLTLELKGYAKRLPGARYIKI